MRVKFYMARQSIFLSFIFLIFMTDTNADATDRISRIIWEKLLRMKYEKQFIKDSEVGTLISQDEVCCEPRNVVEEIPSSSDSVNFYLIPNFIPVRRCIGWCHPSHKCVPVTVLSKSANVHRFLDNRIDVYKVDYLNHESCTCECKIKQEHCSASQTYDALNCICKCSKKPKACPLNKQWSNIECGCTCSEQSPICKNGKTWNKDKCLCECLIECCPNGKKLDKDNCLCNI